MRLLAKVAVVERWLQAHTILDAAFVQLDRALYQLFDSGAGRGSSMLLFCFGDDK